MQLVVVTRMSVVVGVEQQPQLQQRLTHICFVVAYDGDGYYTHYVLGYPYSCGYYCYDNYPGIYFGGNDDDFDDDFDDIWQFAVGLWSC